MMVVFSPLPKYLLNVFYPAVDCGPLSVPTNGSSSGNNTAFPNSMLFDCDPGFILSGSSKRTCQPNGTWSGFATMCTGRFQRYFLHKRGFSFFIESKVCLLHRKQLPRNVNLTMHRIGTVNTCETYINNTIQDRLRCILFCAITMFHY